MVEKIDRNLGRKRLVSLISEPSENFIRQYLSMFKEN